jgi:hypothetical protein
MYPGRCRLFEKLEGKSSLRRSIIRSLWHPCIFFATGGIIFLFNPLLGLPLMICGVSYFIVFAVEYSAGFEKERMAAIKQYDGAQHLFDNKFQSSRRPDRPDDISPIQDKW